MEGRGGEEMKKERGGRKGKKERDETNFDIKRQKKKKGSH